MIKSKIFSCRIVNSDSKIPEVDEFINKVGRENITDILFAGSDGSYYMYTIFYNE